MALSVDKKTKEEKAALEKAAAEKMDKVEKKKSSSSVSKKEFDEMRTIIRYFVALRSPTEQATFYTLFPSWKE